MSFLNKLNFLKTFKDTYANSYGVTTKEDSSFEDGYRSRWQYDKIVRSTHGVNCTGSCSWRIFVKKGIVTWELQQVDYPETRPDMPNHEPRGCARGASYSWYLYSSHRVKHPLVRSKFLAAYRNYRKTFDPITAYDKIVSDKALSREYKALRGRGSFVRSNWNEVNEIIAAANCHTVKNYGPDRIIGFSPIPAMSMISYASGTRYLSMLGGTCLSFYDWYCDLPPASPQTWGEQTDVPESADWYNSGYLILWGSNVPMTRTPDAHFYTEVRYKGTKTAAVCPDFSEMAKFADYWLPVKQGTDAALALAMGHVILKEFYLDRQSEYFTSYAKQYTDLPILVTLQEEQGVIKPSYCLRADNLVDNLNETNNPEWKTVCFDSKSQSLVVPRGSIGFRWGEKGKWNIHPLSSAGEDIDPVLSVKDLKNSKVCDAAFNDFTVYSLQNQVLRKVPYIEVTGKDGSKIKVCTVFDLLLANYGLNRGFECDSTAVEYSEVKTYTPAWQESITGIKAEMCIKLAREFAHNAEVTEGRSMVIIGAGVNHWYHMDMTYRAIINMLMLCGTVGKSGGGWAHYVGQEKLRPQTGWLPLAFSLDWQRPARQMNSTSFFYNHTGQWRHEKLSVAELTAADVDNKFNELALIDYNAKAERMGFLPSAPQLTQNPLDITQKARELGVEPVAYAVENLVNGNLSMSCMEPDDPRNFPRNMFIWRSNLLGCAGKGHEYFLKYLLGTDNAVFSEEENCIEPVEVHKGEACEGKLDLLVTLDFRFSSTCAYSDIVLPSATWYEKDDLNTSDMHPFIHPFNAAVNPQFESKTDFEIFKGIAKKFSELAKDYIGTREDLVLTPLMHDTPQELAQSYDPKDWYKKECEAIPGKTMPAMTVVNRDYGQVYEKYTAVGPLLEKLGNGGKGISWDTKEEVESLRARNGVVNEGVAKNQPRIETAIDAAEVILNLAPETNGNVAVKAWQALSATTGCDHTHLALSKKDERIHFKDIVEQPRKIITSPIWSGIESHKVSYNSGYTNVHECIPWRTLTGRQHFYQDHKWMRAFAEDLCIYKPPVDFKTTSRMLKRIDNKDRTLVLNFMTPHQKWGIHSMYTENPRMLTLSRGGPHAWISENDASRLSLQDNDWIELLNDNGAAVVRAVVSQRVPDGVIIMYHAQEKIVNTPVSNMSGKRGGIHNSMTKTVLKPTHMIGGYAQLAYGFNYYGTVGSNRDDYVVVRKVQNLKWEVV